MAKINYDGGNKVDLVTTIVDKVNKVVADDMARIRTTVNTNDDEKGDIATLSTTDKSSNVAAINEVKTLADQNESDIVDLENDKANDFDVVHLSGNETIYDLKIFEGILTSFQDVSEDTIIDIVMSDPLNPMVRLLNSDGISLLLRIKDDKGSLTFSDSASPAETVLEFEAPTSDAKVIIPNKNMTVASDEELQAVISNEEQFLDAAQTLLRMPKE